VQKVDHTGASTVTTDYLIDPQNHTGYAQVLHESSNDGTDISTIMYTIGLDVLSQARSVYHITPQTTDYYNAQYMLYDGHGSTRQLADSTGATIDEHFSRQFFVVRRL
jgi:hypothetical protein